jgi:SAM-dependent methyltransferase
LALVMFLRENEVGSRVAPHLSPGWHVLDYGSGTGLVSRWLAERRSVRPVLADLVDYHNRRRDLSFIRLDDPFNVPAADGAYDAVLLLFMLHHNPYETQGKVVAEAARLAARAVIVLEDTPFNRIDWLLNSFWDRVLNLRHRVPTPLAFRSVSEWEALFMEHGLSTALVESYRPKWPTLMTYHHTLFVLGREGR